MVVGNGIEILWLKIMQKLAKSSEDDFSFTEISVRAGANSYVLVALTYFQSKLSLKETCPMCRYLRRTN